MILGQYWLTAMDHSGLGSNSVCWRHSHGLGSQLCQTGQKSYDSPWNFKCVIAALRSPKS